MAPKGAKVEDTSYSNSQVKGQKDRESLYFKQDQSTCLMCALSFLFLFDVDEK